LNSCFGAESLSRVLLISKANGFPNDNALSNILRLFVNGGLLIIISHFSGSYSKKSCQLSICEYVTSNHSSFNSFTKLLSFVSNGHRIVLYSYIIFILSFGTISCHLFNSIQTLSPQICDISKSSNL